jgi:hypothetical protein
MAAGKYRNEAITEGVKYVLTFEDVTGYFLKAAASIQLTTHPEYWTNNRTLEREFTCACHPGPCDDIEEHGACTMSLTWGPLETILSLEGTGSMCDFFHEPKHDCSHRHTTMAPSLLIELTYTQPLYGVTISEEALLSLTQMLKLRASEHSKRTIETQPRISMALHENRLRPDMLMLQQRVALPIWHPEGIHALPDDFQLYGRPQLDEDEENPDVPPDEPHPEEWLPQFMVEVCQDIVQVLDALDATLTYKPSNNA